MARRPLIPPVLPLLTVLAAAACTGVIDGAGTSDPSAGPGADEGSGSSGPGAGTGSTPGASTGATGAGAGAGIGGMGSGTGGSGGGGSGTGGEPDPGDSPDGVPLSTRFARLTHTQYDNTASELLHLNVNASGAFLKDPIFAGHDNSAEGLAVAGRLGRDYRRAAEELAAAFVADGQAYGAVVSCSPSDSGCARQFIEDFGLQAYRRPLTETEITRYLGLHAQGADLVASGDAFRDGVEVVVEAFLQSPNFLYRVESSTEVNADGFISLNGYEVASRLSYMLWNTMPDDALFNAAAMGQLDSAAGVAAQAERLLEDPRARGVVEDFHHQWLDLEHYRDLTKSATLYPEFQRDLSDSLQEETERFIEHVVFEMDGGLDQLLRGQFTFVNEDLAPLYGLSGITGPDFVRVDLDATRSGFLTHIGFLASRAYTTNTSPIHRGVFILRRILCFPLPDPPGDVDLNLPPITGEIKTTRQQVSTHTSPNSCTNCHGIINPIGFAFENFDSIGRFRTTENGVAVDTTGTVPLDGDTVSFDNAADMIDAIASSEDARRCYAKNWLTYAYGREDRESDTRTLDDLTAAIADPNYSVKALLTNLTQTKAFRNRAPNTVYQP